MTLNVSTSLATAAFALLLVASPAQAGDASYSYSQIGTFGGPSSAAFGLNDLGQVVGWANIPACFVNGHPCRHAFLWDDGVMTDLGVLPGDEESVGRAINNSGVVAGTSEFNVNQGSGTYHAAVFGNGAPVALPDLGLGQSWVQDINEAGQMVGFSGDPVVDRDRAVVWQGGTISNVGDTESHAYNRAEGISETGELVGFAWNLFQPNDSIRFDGSWSVIGGVDGPFQNSEAKDVNSAGVVVGFQAFPSGNWHAAVWTPGSPGAKDLGSLPGLEVSELFDVNEAGWAVGRAYGATDPNNSRAVLYNGVELLDLNDFMPAGFDGVLIEAQEINENGDIAGSAVVGGALRGFLLTANENPWTDLGSGLAGVNGVPVLEGTGSLAGGTAVSLDVSNGAPSANSWFVAGFTRIDAPFKQGILVPALDLLVGPLPLDGSGSVALPFTWPNGAPSGVSLFVQGWIVDGAGPAGWAASNGIEGVTP
ncbi:MAG: putative HAF family extracellular repeat protein [Pseudohongiellaceae bacterium]|jgi:probable HAF family extracellular repeat protein